MSSLILYNSARFYHGKGMIDWSSSPFKLALLANGYTFDAAAHTVYADLTNEVANGNGYTTGGVALTGQTWTESTTTCTFDADDTEFPASGGSIGPFRKASLYVDATVSLVVKPLVGYTLVAAADLTIPDGIAFLMRWNASGIITLSGASS